MPPSTPTNPLKVAIATGTRAEFGLLLPIIQELQADQRFQTKVLCAGMHLVHGIDTWTEVESTVGIDARIPMQTAKTSTRADDAIALARGVAGFAQTLPTIFDSQPPDWLLILGDRIEAFAAASVAALAGIPIAHLHGGDRAEGVADEAMRHAITKLANLHLPATQTSANRIARMGEPEDRIITVGSPAICNLETIKPLPHAANPPTIILLYHPAGLPDELEHQLAQAIAQGIALHAKQHNLQPNQILWLAPNADPGSAAVRDAIAPIAEQHHWQTAQHLSRQIFLAHLATLATNHGALVGNSSAALIEAAALHTAAVNCGPRQRGRERAQNIIDIRDHAHDITPTEVATAIEQARTQSGQPTPHPYGNGQTHKNITKALKTLGQLTPLTIRKQSTY